MKNHVNKKTHQKKQVLVSLVFSVFVLLAILGGRPVMSANLTTPAQTLSITQQIAKDEIPELSVVKYTDKNETEVGGSFTITIRILNYSNKTAFNVTVIEPTFPSWAFDVSGANNFRYDRIEPGMEQIITYVMVSKTVGNFTLESTTVTFYDSRDVTTQRKLTAVSNYLDLTVLPPGSNTLDKFQALFEATVTFFLILLALGTVRYFSLRYHIKKKGNAGSKAV